MARWLVVIAGPDAGTPFPLFEGRTVYVGSSRKKAGICLHDPRVARLHCRLKCEGDRVTLDDLERSSGTFVNDRKVGCQELQPGDVLRVGASQLRLEAVAEPSAPSPDQTLPDIPPPGDWAERLIGETLGRIEAVALIGRGHSGAVFRGRDREQDRTVALKVLSPEFPEDGAEKERFIRAMKAILPLRHRNIVALYGMGKSAGHCWLAMEHVEGGGVEALIREVQAAERFDWRPAFRVAVHVARALDCARRNHLIHRNITPRNVLWDRADQVAKLGDFKLQKALEFSALQQNVFREKFAAELPWLAPEQAEGDDFGDDLSDVYSLGAVVYALLTGRPPCQGESLRETMKLIREAPPEKPRKFHKTIPAELEQVVLHMLAKNPAHRYQNPAELLADLDRIAEENGLIV